MPSINGCLLGFLIALPGLSVGQLFRGQITDSQTKAVLPYASIGVKAKPIGDIADLKGNFRVDLSTAVPNDTIVISYLGYQPKSLVKREINDSTYAIKLVPIAYQLSEFVTRGKLETIVIGNKRASGQFTGWGDYFSSRGRLRGLAIEPQETPLKLARFILHLHECEFDSVRFRLHLLPLLANHSGNIHQELIHENIFFTAYKDQKKVVINLLPYNLTIQEPLIAAVEWVDAWAPSSVPKRSYLLTISLSREEGYQYIRETPEEAFSVIKMKLTPTMYFEAYRPGKAK